MPAGDTAPEVRAAMAFARRRSEGGATAAPAGRPANESAFCQVTWDQDGVVRGIPWFEGPPVTAKPAPPSNQKQDSKPITRVHPDGTSVRTPPLSLKVIRVQQTHLTRKESESRLQTVQAVLTRGAGEKWGLDISDENRVMAVAAESPAMNAGLRVGDRVVEAQGDPLKQPLMRLCTTEPHLSTDTLRLCVVRDEDERPGQPPAAEGQAAATGTVLIASNQIHGKLRQLPLTGIATLQSGLSATENEQPVWHLCTLLMNGSGVSCQPTDPRYDKAQKKFVPTPPGKCSLWVGRDDHTIFALCSEAGAEAQVLVMTADAVSDAEQWVRALAGRLYLNELQLDDATVEEYIGIFHLFDADGSGGISLDELQVASKGLGNPKTAEELVGLLAGLDISLDSRGAISLPQFLRVLKDGQLTGTATSLVEVTVPGAAPPADAPLADDAPPSELERERMVAEIKASHAATLTKGESRLELCKRLQGVLFKRSTKTPIYQPRWMFVSPDGAHLCYREGDVDGKGTGEEKRIPLASVSALALESERHFEFSLDSTTHARQTKFRFRAQTSAELMMWLDGLAELAP